MFFSFFKFLDPELVIKKKKNYSIKIKKKSRMKDLKKKKMLFFNNIRLIHISLE